MIEISFSAGTIGTMSNNTVSAKKMWDKFVSSLKKNVSPKYLNRIMVRQILLGWLR